MAFSFCDVDVFVCNEFMLDSEIYQIWLNGLTAHQAVVLLQRVRTTEEWPAEALLSDVNDNFRTFSMLEPLLHAPRRLAESSPRAPIQVGTLEAQELVERYYALDEAVARELLARKLTARHRKELDEVSDRTEVPLRACRRHFDNLRRIVKWAVEEGRRPLAEGIQRQFLLSTSLAERYSALVFLCVHRLEVSKRRLARLNLGELSRCAVMILEHWTDAEGDACDWDREFLLELREQRATLSDKEAIERTIGLASVRLRGQRPRFVSEVQSQGRELLRALLALPGALHQPRTQRDLLCELSERVAEPCVALGWSREELNLFLSALHDALLQALAPSKRVQALIERFCVVALPCINVIFPAVKGDD